MLNNVAYEKNEVLLVSTFNKELGKTTSLELDFYCLVPTILQNKQDIKLGLKTWPFT